MNTNIIRDRMANADPTAVAQATMQLLDRLQDEPADVQMLSAACLYMALQKHLQIKPTEAFQFAANLMEDADGRRPEFRAVTAYVKGELSE